MVWKRTRSPHFLSNFFCCCCCRSKRTAHSSSSSSEASLLLQKEEDDVVITKPGWKAMPYILGNEAVEKMATYGLTTNLMVYLVREYHMDQVFAANLLSMWICALCLFTVLGASLADTYLGKFRTILFASFASLLGMTTITVTASVPQLRPPPCDLGQHCISSTKIQLWILIMGLSWLGIGSAGIRPCSLPFGLDQFDTSTVEGRLATHSFLNWYYTSGTLVVLINQVFLVYIQDSVSWALGFGIPTLLMMLCAIPLFLVGSNIYVCVKPGGSIFLSFAQVLVAAYKKRHLKVLNDERVQGVLFDGSLDGNAVVSKLPLSTQSSFLKKAALVVDNDLKDGLSVNAWRLCTIQQVEDVMYVKKTLPIWASGGIFLLAFVQEGTFMVSQALKMDRHIGTKLQMPAGAIKMMSLSIIIIWLPLYDRVIQPALKRITKSEDGIPTLKKIGIGYIFSILCMLVAGLVEQQRRTLATLHGESPNGVAPISVFWLFPQLVLLGLSEVFGALGHIEFYNKEFPEKMKSIGNSLIYLCMAGATYLSSLVVTIVHSFTGKHGQPNWLDNDINAGSYKVGLKTGEIVPDV
ncbi:PREDICTED: nitrate transporter 1.7-like [Fragaria vesca subsp. vesca]